MTLHVNKGLAQAIAESPDQPQHHPHKHLTLGQRIELSFLGLSSLYALFLVAVYIALVFTEQVTFPVHADLSEANGYFLYLYIIADIFLVYLFVLAIIGNTQKIRLLEHSKSHGSLSIRFGAVVFGVGTLIYFILEGLALHRIDAGSECDHPVLGANVFFVLVFIILQTALIFTFPRFNLHYFHIIDRLGLMHLVATNAILWIRTLIKESLHELEESAHEKVLEASKPGRVARETVGDGGHGSGGHGSGDSHAIPEELKCDTWVLRLHEEEARHEACMASHNEHHANGSHHVTEKLIESSPMLYPFVIEYALIGACVFFLMWKHVKVVPADHMHDDPTVIHKPNPAEFLRRRRWLSFRKGLFAGLFIVALAIANLAIFFGLEGDEHEQNLSAADYVTHSINTIINIFGIIAVIIGIHEIQKLKQETDEECEDEVVPDTLDLGLLRFSVFFFYVYLVFLIIVGVFNPEPEKFSSALPIVNGIIEIVQITIQIIFIIDLKSKALTREHERSESRPGRQFTVFLFIMNLAQWVVVTFEIQKMRSSPLALTFFGNTAWVLIQRVTLPLAVFFRFHSAVVCIELAKEVYSTT